MNNTSQSDTIYEEIIKCLFHNLPIEIIAIKSRIKELYSKLENENAKAIKNNSIIEPLKSEISDLAKVKDILNNKINIAKTQYCKMRTQPPVKLQIKLIWEISISSIKRIIQIHFSAFKFLLKISPYLIGAAFLSYWVYIFILTEQGNAPSTIKEYEITIATFLSMLYNFFFRLPFFLRLLLPTYITVLGIIIIKIAYKKKCEWFEGQPSFIILSKELKRYNNDILNIQNGIRLKNNSLQMPSRDLLTHMNSINVLKKEIVRKESILNNLEMKLPKLKVFLNQSKDITVSTKFINSSINLIKTNLENQKRVCIKVIKATKIMYPIHRETQEYWTEGEIIQDVWGSNIVDMGRGPPIKDEITTVTGGGFDQNATTSEQIRLRKSYNDSFTICENYWHDKIKLLIKLKQPNLNDVIICLFSNISNIVDTDSIKFINDTNAKLMNELVLPQLKS